MVIASLFSLASFNLLVRCLAFVLFSRKGGANLVSLILGGEFLLYMLLKAARGDLQYWAPVYGVIGPIISFLMRLIVKCVADWTAVVQFRHPSDVGGAYFTFNLGISIAMGVYAVQAYTNEAEEGNEGGSEGFQESTVKLVMYCLSGGMVMSYALLLASVEREYLHTFISLKTSNEQVQQQFTHNQDDEQKFKIFGNHTGKWEYKIAKEVKVWLNKQLPIWLDEVREIMGRGMSGHGKYSCLTANLLRLSLSSSLITVS